MNIGEEERITKKKITITKALKSRIAIALLVSIIMGTAAISTTQFRSIPAFAQDVSSDGVRLDQGEQALLLEEKEIS